MTLTSTVLDPTAVRLQTIAQTVLNGFGLSTPTPFASKWSPDELVALPAAVVEMPTITRTGVEESESQIGSNDWTLEYPVVLYCELSDASFSQAQVIQAVEAFIKAIDADPGLGGTVLDAKVTESTPSFIDDQTRALVAYTCITQVWQLV